MVLTPAGQTLFDYARRVLDLAEEARQAVLPAKPQGRLRIASMESTAASRLPAVLAAYHQAWPEVQLELVTCPTRQALQALARFEVDCAFVAEPLDDPALASLPVFQEELVLVAREHHAPIHAPADLETRTMLAFEPGCNYRMRLESWLAGGDSPPRRVLELGSYHAIIACAAAGIGVAIVPRSVLGLYRDLPRISLHALGAAGKVDTLLAWPPAMANTALRALVDTLRAPRPGLAAAA